LDNNIQTVGDTGYNSYNGAAINYNTTAVRSGETVEASVAGVLWDLYDNDAESHDRLALGHTSFWNLSINSGAKTLSSLINYFNANYSSYYYTSRINITSSKNKSYIDFPSFLYKNRKTGKISDISLHSDSFSGKLRKSRIFLSDFFLRSESIQAVFV